MWPDNYFPDYGWPVRYWSVPNDWAAGQTNATRTRTLLQQRWAVTLINASGTRYALGRCDIDDSGGVSAIVVPDSVPNGTYDVEVRASGLAWEGLIQKTFSTVVIDRTGSEPIETGLPILTGLRYDYYEGWVRILWEGDIPPVSAGLVSAGLWLSAGVPNFSASPSVTLPLFSHQSTHCYLLRDGSFATYIGLAAIDGDGNQGSEQYIALPDLTLLCPPAALVED
jgi:hypothetical protein